MTEIVLNTDGMPLDGDPREHVRRLRDYAKHLDDTNIYGAAVLNYLADQIEEQTRPPKPDEPTGLGAVVEDAERLRYVYAPDSPTDIEPWVCRDAKRGGFYAWDEIAAVTILSNGVQP